MLVKGKIEDYLIEEKIATGKFGTVYKAIGTKTKQFFILKKLSSQYEPMSPPHQSPDIPNFSTICERIENNADTYIVKPYEEGSDLKMILTQPFKHWRLNRLFFIDSFITLLENLEHLHANNILHKDIKPSNILIKHHNEKPSQWSGKKVTLIDLEQCVDLNYPTKIPKRIPFSMIYSPPESILNFNHLLSYSSDLFSVGICMYQVFNGSIPFRESNPEILINKALNIPLPQTRKIDHQLMEIILKATAKKRFRLPPRMLEQSEINLILSEGIARRYQSASEMKKALLHYKARLEK